MLVLGIDPGTALTGYGVVRGARGSILTPVCHGCIRTESDWPLARKLQAVYQEVSRIITESRPDAVAVEELFFNQNARTAIAVAQGRGVTLLAAAEAGCPVFEYPPLAVKRAVTGNGRATKEQVRYMVQHLLRLQTLPSPDDAADALACAICHLNTSLTITAYNAAPLDRGLGR